MFNIDLTITIVMLIVDLIIGLLVLFRNFKKKVNRYFFLFLLFLLLWKVTLSLYLNTHDEAHLLLVGRINFAVATIMAYFALMFANNFPENVYVLIKSRLIHILLVFYTLTVIVITLCTDLVSKREFVDNGEHATEFGSLYIVFISHLIGFLILSLVILLIKYIKAKGIPREQIFFLLSTFCIAAIWGIITALILPFYFQVFSLEQFAPLGTILISIGVFISIVRYRFLDIKLILGKFTYVLSLSLITYLIYYLTAYLLIQSFGDIFKLESFVINIFFALTFVIFFDFISGIIKEKVESVIIYSTYNPQKIISEFSNTINKELDAQKILHIISENVQNTIKPEFFFIVFKTPQGQFKVSQNNFTIRFGPSEYDGIVNLLNAEADSLVIADEFEIELDKSNATFNNNTRLLFKKLQDIKAEILAPIKQADDIFGIILLGKKGNGSTYNSGEISFLKSIATLSSLALARSVLYEAVEDFNTNLSKKVEEATAELNLKNQALAESLRKEKDMIDVLSHELRTPAGSAKTAVLMFEMTVNNTKLTPEQRNIELKKLTGIAAENLRRLSSILTTLLNATRLDNNRLKIDVQKVDAKEVVNDAYDSFNDQATKRKLLLKLNIPVATLFCMADRDGIQQIVDNLVSNAIKYTDSGEINITLGEDSGYVKFSVKDTGRGIPPEEIPKLGRKFYRVDTYLREDAQNQDMKILRPDGTGIGLYVVKGLISAMGGKLEIISEGRGKGSEFIAYLPKTS